VPGFDIDQKPVLCSALPCAQRYSRGLCDERPNRLEFWPERRRARENRRKAMSDFSSDIWLVYMAVITVVSAIACAALLIGHSTRRAATAGAYWEDDLAGYNSPLPSWWKWPFCLTIVFALIYLALCLGFSSFAGIYA
jgi:hypothetical protein